MNSFRDAGGGWGHTFSSGLLDPTHWDEALFIAAIPATLQLWIAVSLRALAVPTWRQAIAAWLSESYYFACERHFVAFHIFWRALHAHRAENVETVVK